MNDGVSEGVNGGVNGGMNGGVKPEAVTVTAPQDRYDLSLTFTTPESQPFTPPVSAYTKVNPSPDHPGAGVNPDDAQVNSLSLSLSLSFSLSLSLSLHAHT